MCACSALRPSKISRVTSRPATSCSICAIPRWARPRAVLLRALGLGRAVLVSEVGAFAELPDDVCLKVPVGPGEEDLIFEFLNLLVSRRDLAQSMGQRARAYVERECNWDAVAERYASFLCAVKDGRDWQEPETSAAPQPASAPVAPEYIAGWAAEPSAREYVQDALHASDANARNHATRRARRLHSRNGRVSADHARAAHQAGLRHCARLLLRPGGPRGPAHRDLRGRRALRVRRSICSTPRRTRFLIPTDASPRCCAAS